MENVQDIYELAPMQHGLLFDSVTAGNSGMYMIQLDYVLHGRVDREVLERAWQGTLDRHAILRTSFHWDEIKTPLQIVHGEIKLEVAYRDWRESSNEDLEHRLAVIRDEDRVEGFDFENPPLMRLTLFQVGDESFRLLWSFHHLLMEGWSASLVLDEVMLRYRCELSGEPLELPSHRPYRDYITWIQAQDPKVAKAYWSKVLAGYEGSTPLRVGKAPSGLQEPVAEFDGQVLTMSVEKTAALRAFGKQHELTLNTLVQGAWAVMLSAYTGQTDVAFGAVVSGRSVPLEGVESIIGLFVNLLPTRVVISPDDVLVDWLRQLQKCQVEQREFEYVGLAEVKAWSQIPAGTPMFETLLVFQNWTGNLTATRWNDELSVEEVTGHHGSPGYPAAAVIVPGDELILGISHDKYRFTAEDIARMLACLKVVLSKIADGTAQTLRDLPLLDGPSRQRVLGEWNSEPSTDAPVCVHADFERQVDETPNATALVEGDLTWTYAELDQRANQVANAIATAGVGQGERIALCVQREAGMVAAMIGCLKAGCAYIPMDPSHPKGRLASLLEDAEPALFLVGESVLDRLPDGAEGPTRLLLSGPEIADAPSSRPGRTVGADDQAYMIYTSGSTGRPKGVQVSHRSMANFVAHCLQSFDLSSSDRVLQFASISFDTAIEEIFPTLVTGATLVLRNDAMLGSVDAFLEACTDQAITLIDFPTAYWHVIVQGLADAQCPFPESVRLIILGGERARPEHLADWFRAVPKSPRVLNTYGPTEGTVVATSCELTEADLGAAELPIGRPILNGRAYILDPRGEPVPVGVPGELHIAGAGVADGYFRRPELTDERFIPDPFVSTAGARMYRSGDLARYRADGNIEYVGRLDNQVKFRGFRIELEEIEVALCALDSVQDAAVLLREDTPGHPRLVAYVVPGSPAPEADQLRTLLAEDLPPYMVPSVTVVLDALPLTPHGKVDRRALPEPEQRQAAPADASLVPSTELEKKVAAIWTEVLEVKGINLQDNFFDLGGHSLLLMPVIGELKKQVGVELDPGDLVLPTLRQLVALCEERIANPPPPKKRGWVRRVVGAFKDREGDAGQGAAR